MEKLKWSPPGEIETAYRKSIPIFIRNGSKNNISCPLSITIPLSILFSFYFDLYSQLLITEVL